MADSKPDRREWILRWDHRQMRHYIDGPTGGYETEGISVVPKARAEAAERELRAAREALTAIEQYVAEVGPGWPSSSLAKSIGRMARAALSTTPDTKGNT